MLLIELSPLIELIITRTTGTLGLVANLLSFQFKKHKHILFFRTVNESLFIIQYFILGAFTGAFLNIIGCIRNIVFTKQVALNKKTVLSTVIFSTIFTVFGLLTFDGLKSIMLIFAKVLSTVAYGNKNTTVIRAVSFSTHICYLFYNLFVFSYEGALTDAVLLISLIFGIIRFDILPKVKKSQKQD